MRCNVSIQHVRCCHWAAPTPTIIRRQHNQLISLDRSQHPQISSRSHRCYAGHGPCQQRRAGPFTTRQQKLEYRLRHAAPATDSAPELPATQRFACCLAVLAACSTASNAHAAIQPGPQLDLVAELSPKQAELLALVSRPVLAVFIFLMLVRIVLTWYPNIKENKLPWSVATFPTEFFLGPTRRTFPPVGGVDIAPVRR